MSQKLTRSTRPPCQCKSKYFSSTAILVVRTQGIPQSDTMQQTSQKKFIVEKHKVAAVASSQKEESHQRSG